MQNKANFLNVKMNATSLLTKDYENKSVLEAPKNKPNQSQFQNPANGTQSIRYFLALLFTIDYCSFILVFQTQGMVNL